jgi:hypothetical protein
MHWLLVIVTYMGGNAWGPIVQTQQLSSKSQCEIAAKAVIEQVDEMSKTNATATGQTKNGATELGRKVVTAKCKDLDAK